MAEGAGARTVTVCFGTWQYHVMSGALSLQLAQVQEIVDLSATQSFSSSSDQFDWFRNIEIERHPARSS